MPAKNSKLINGHRDHIISEQLYRRFKEDNALYLKENDIKLDYQTFKLIIVKSNKAIADIITTEPEGFKLPENLGYLVVTRYKTKLRPTDYKRSKDFGTQVIHNNLHSEGDMFSLRWFNQRITNNVFASIYKYTGNRVFKRNVAKSIKNETQFLHWTHNDFFNYNNVMKVYNSIKKKDGSD